jgi:hypothetical protein
MEYKKIGETYYIRMDRGDKVVTGIMDICSSEGIKSAVYSGIGGCSSAQIQTFIPEKGEFETEEVQGMLELVSLTGNVVTDDDGTLHHHTHAMFAYKENDAHHSIGGHLKETTVLYTAEIELRPTLGGHIGRKYNEETGTGFWKF